MPLFHKCPTCPKDKATWIDRARTKCASCQGVVFTTLLEPRVVTFRSIPQPNLQPDDDSSSDDLLCDENFHCWKCDKIPLGKMTNGMCDECWSSEQFKCNDSLIEEEPIVLTDDPVDDFEFLSD